MKKKEEIRELKRVLAITKEELELVKRKTEIIDIEKFCLSGDCPELVEYYCEAKEGVYRELDSRSIDNIRNREIVKIKGLNGELVRIEKKIEGETKRIENKINLILNHLNLKYDSAEDQEKRCIERAREDKLVKVKK